jgi:hypothetical protein
LVENLRTSVVQAAGFSIGRLDDRGGELVGSLNGWTWGRIIEFRLLTERGGTTVSATWKPRFPLQIITWGQETRDLTSFRGFVTSPARS